MAHPTTQEDDAAQLQEVSAMLNQAAAAAGTSTSNARGETGIADASTASDTQPCDFPFSGFYRQSDFRSSLTDAGPAPEHAALRHEDLVHDPPEDDIPPPAYGDHYGTIENEQDGFGTDARVAGQYTQLLISSKL